jgi:hypothetical protein
MSGRGSSERWEEVDRAETVERTVREEPDDALEATEATRGGGGGRRRDDWCSDCGCDEGKEDGEEDGDRAGGGGVAGPMISEISVSACIDSE